MGIQLKSNDTPGRNDPCPCKSGLKFKHCHGDDMKRAVCNRVANEKMCDLILQEKIKRGLISFPYTCTLCGQGFEETKKSMITGGAVSPCCDSTSFTENKPEIETEKQNG